jgi:enolase
VKGKSPDSKLSVADGQHSPENGEDQIQAIIKNINTCIKPALVGTELYDQQEINRILE